MKTTALKLAALALFIAGCTQNKDIQLQPLSKNEVRAIHTSLVTGRPLDEVQSSTSDSCEAPAFFGMNVQGKVTVPEDYSHPEGRKIEVYYYGRLQTGKDPVVFFNGGPASDSHGSAQLLENFMSVPEAQKLSFIYVDQRGTGCSDLFPSELTAENVERLTHYTSAEIVKDSEVVREKVLGPKSKWKVFGQSFGGLIVHRYALTAADSISGAYAHGFSLMTNQDDWLALRVKSQKRVSDLYFAKYPNDRRDLAEIRNLIHDDMCFTDNETRVCGAKVMDALTIFLGFSNNWDYLHQYIDRILTKDGKLDQDVLNQFVRNYVFGVYNNNGLAASVISATEISGGGSDQDSCKKAQAQLQSQGEEPDTWLINECRLLAGMQNDQMAELLKGITVNFQMTPEQMKQSLEQHPQVPFYLYSGQKDVFVPVETFAEEVKALGSRIKYQSFPNSGHEGFYTESQVWSDLLATH